MVLINSRLKTIQILGPGKAFLRKKIQSLAFRGSCHEAPGDLWIKHRQNTMINIGE